MPKHAYVLEQLVRHRELSDQEGLARRLARHLAPLPGVRGVASARGLSVLGINELFLNSAADRLEDFMPGQLLFFEPTVVYRTDPFREPYMQLVIDMPCILEHEIQSWLRTKGSEIIATTRGLPRTTLHALGPLRRLLGCHAELMRLSAAQAELEIVFSHYEESTAQAAVVTAS